MIFRFGLLFLITTTLLLLIAPLGNADSHCDFAEETVLIGGVVPLSAPGSVAGGIGMKWGFEQAVADINADCGIEIAGANHTQLSHRHRRFGRRPLNTVSWWLSA